MSVSTNGNHVSKVTEEEQQNGKSLFDRIEEPQIPKQTRRAIALLEREMLLAEVEQLRKSTPLLRPIYEKRNALIKSQSFRNSDFWLRVFQGAPAEIDEYILPSDATVLNECLRNLEVERFEVDDKGQGEPRSLRLVFEFAVGDENPYFDNERLVKELYWRKKATVNTKGKLQTWEGFVSEPVRIKWKEGQDLTRGLLDAACDLFDAENSNGVDRRTLPEYEKLVEKLDEQEELELDVDHEDEEDGEDSMGGRRPIGVSFFAFFGHRGEDISAERSQASEKIEEEHWKKIAAGEEDFDEGGDDEDDEDGEGDEDDSLQGVEIFPGAEELAVSIAEDLWPNALKLYVQSYVSTSGYDWESDPDDEEDGKDEEDDNDNEAETEDDDEGDRPRKKVKT